MNYIDDILSKNQNISHEQFDFDGGGNDYVEKLKVSNLTDDFNKTCKKKGYPNKLPHIIPANKYKRIIVIGDLHGDVAKTLKALLIAKVIDKNNNWIGGKTAVVQIGDQLDGCRPSGSNDDCSQDDRKDYADIKVMDILDNIHKKAIKKGGAVFSLLGNHEMMQENGNRYISPKSYAYFNNYTDPKTGKTIANGKKARAHAFKPGNEYAVRLACTRQAALIIGSWLFVHAGVLPELSTNKDGTVKMTVKQINLVVRKWLLGQLTTNEEIQGVGTVGDIINNYNLSPFWPRFFGTMKPNKPMSHHICREKLKPTLKVYGINGMIVGHTPQFMYGRSINSTCNNKLWRVDVGMSSAFKKFSSRTKSRARKVQVLQIKNDGKNPKSDFTILAEL